ncbi:MAG: leucine-rich repeat domain-containing protein [Candidatus Hodarchaeales archaeon]|jgi:antitoxin component of MazEF toxin-antitoxin module
MDTEYRRIIKVGNTYGVTIPISSAKKYGFDHKTEVRVDISNGLVIITRKGEKQLEIDKIQNLADSDINTEQPPLIKADEQNLHGLEELSYQLGYKSLAWINQLVFGYNSNFRLGEKRRRAVIRREQVAVLNLDLMTIQQFPDSINSTNFPSLKGLRMTGCQLSVVDLSSIASLPFLEKLVLSDNDIDDIDLLPLSNVSKLSALFLDGNLLDQIDLKPLKELKNVETISLSSNELEEVDLRPLIGLSNLKELYLDNNHLADIDLTPLTKTKGLYLSLENNPLDDIDLESLFSIDGLQVRLPEDLSDRTLELVEVLQEKGAMVSAEHMKKLTPDELYNLPPDLQDTALIMLSLVEGTAERIAKEADKHVDDILKEIISLQNMGYVGKKRKEGKTIYFISD